MILLVIRALFYNKYVLYICYNTNISEVQDQTFLVVYVHVCNPPKSKRCTVHLTSNALCVKYETEKLLCILTWRSLTVECKLAKYGGKK